MYVLRSTTLLNKRMVLFSYLGEERGPVWLNVHSGRLEDGGDLLRRDGHIIVSQDEGSVGAGELSVGHCYCASFFADLAQKIENKHVCNQDAKISHKGREILLNSHHKHYEIG